jgi:hypothetical protein
MPEAAEKPPEQVQRNLLQGSELTRITSSVLVTLASQVAVLAAVLFYFGWVRAKATYQYFGIDISVLNFSASDYVLHSVDAAFPMLLALILVGLAAAIAHEKLRPQLASDPIIAARIIKGATGTGGALILAGLILAVALTDRNGSLFWGPAVLLAGCSCCAYALTISRRYAGRDGFLPLTAIMAMTVVAFLWTVTAYANYIGVQAAETIRSDLATSADVTVYSTTNLSLNGPGLAVSVVQAPQSEYRFRYSGLRMLVSSGGQYFLLPSAWQQGSGAVIVLPTADAGIRVEFTSSGQ